MNTRRDQWRNQPFSIGLRAKAGTDSLWYKAQNGTMYPTIYDPFIMWWKYIDPSDWNNPHKAVFFEMPWNEFERRQYELMTAIMMVESIEESQNR